MLTKSLRKLVHTKSSNNNPQEIQFSSIILNCENIQIIDNFSHFNQYYSFTYLSQLYISHNRLYTLKGIEQFKNLEIFHFNYNWICQIYDLTFIQNKFFLKEIAYLGNPIQGQQYHINNIKNKSKVQIQRHNLMMKNQHPIQKIGKIQKNNKLFSQQNSPQSYEKRFKYIKLIFPNLQQWNSVSNIIRQCDICNNKLQIQTEMQRQAKYQIKNKQILQFKNNHNQNQPERNPSLISIFPLKRYHQRAKSFQNFKNLQNYPYLKQQSNINLEPYKMRIKTFNGTSYKRTYQKQMASSNQKDSSTYDLCYEQASSSKLSNLSSGKKLQSTKRNTNSYRRPKFQRFHQVQIRPFNGNPTDELIKQSQSQIKQKFHNLKTKDFIIDTARFKGNYLDASQQTYTLKMIQQQRQILVDTFYRRSLLQKSIKALKCIGNNSLRNYFSKYNEQKFKKDAWLRIKINNAIQKQLQNHQDWLIKNQ